MRQHFTQIITSKNVLCKRGMKCLHEIGGMSGREYITVHICACANSERLPPLFCTKAKTCTEDEWVEVLLVLSLVFLNQAGWMQRILYLGLKSSLFQLFNI